MKSTLMETEDSEFSSTRWQRLVFRFMDEVSIFPDGAQGIVFNMMKNLYNQF